MEFTSNSLIFDSFEEVLKVVAIFPQTDRATYELQRWDQGIEKMRKYLGQAYSSRVVKGSRSMAPLMLVRYLQAPYTPC
jgi:hypothetical protein